MRRNHPVSAVFNVCSTGISRAALRRYYEQGRGYVLLAPTLLAMFNAPQLDRVAKEVEDTIVKIMKEAASG